jgi:hypothetical protein
MSHVITTRKERTICGEMWAVVIDGRVDCHVADRDMVDIAAANSIAVEEQHWGRIHEDFIAGDPAIVIANGSAYRIGSARDNPRGFGGAVWRILFFDGRSVRCNSLWHLGKVPADWRKQLPDNAHLREIGYDPW